MIRGVKISLDVAMYILFLYLMSYRSGRGLYLHGILGVALFALFLLHHLLNRHWFRGLFRGRYPLRRIIVTALDGALLVVMVVMSISSVMMSGDVFAFSPFVLSQFARDLHSASAAWGFVITLFHMGFHSDGAMIKLRRRVQGTFFAPLYGPAFFLVLALGLWCFWRTSLLAKMALIHRGAQPFDALTFYGRHIMATLAACQLSHLALRWTKK